MGSNEYFKLREKIDEAASRLEKEHKKHMDCKSGCDLCCMDYDIFPIEFYSILDELKKEKLAPQNFPEKKDQKECIFLKDHRCRIYHSRPIICRTHGLPLLFTNDDAEWQLSACELNFTDFNFEDFTFDNTYPQDTFNSDLFLLNKKFISDFEEEKYSEFDLIPIKKLVENL